jgi:hypothetical protein
MKKVILGLSGILVAALVIVLFVNAQKAPAETSKAAAKAVPEACAGCPSAATCTGMTAEKVSASASAKCDPAKCKEMGCDPAKCKEGKCDPATCKSVCASATTSEAKACAGMATCPMAATK